MTTAIAGLTVAAIAELLTAAGYRVTVATDEVVVGERPILGTYALRRVAAQRNLDDETFRLGYLLARPGQPGGPVYEHELVGHQPRCVDLPQFVDWFAIHDTRAYPAKVEV